MFALYHLVITLFLSKKLAIALTSKTSSFKLNSLWSNQKRMLLK